MNGDGYADLITGTGVGGGPHIKVFDLRGGQPVTIASFFAFEPTFMGGVYVATGDINADGYADIIIGAGQTGGPRVKVFNGAAGYVINTVAPAMDFFAYDPSFTGGVTVSAGQRDTQPGEEVITGAGVGVNGFQVGVALGVINITVSVSGIKPHDPTIDAKIASRIAK